MKKLVLVAAAGAALAALSGCATITRGTNDVFVVETDPIGAAVKTTHGFACDATPCSFKMPRKSEFDVTITKAGYKTWTGHVTNKISGGGGAAMAGNVLVGGIIGAAVDGSSGAMKDLVPNPLIVKLEKADEVPAVAAVQ
ncbi:translation initiation factor 2 [Asticcacaulis sp. ZE23SCel15]|uniref:translation initiation factor 2 n=1 Tax=Asticcacaulis sp. ZE23SCel15 TaxID=3059027 RepID=UPI00265DBF27|nr:translation initiation factor 2 [Asticcacaulis sp. ZE23SCel15]WKL57903.1 translation initiation factor 2 [Asticcacaulis sp. ZE23SCel15]